MIAMFYKSCSFNFITELPDFCFFVTIVTLFNGFLFNLSSLGSYFFSKLYYSSFRKEYIKCVSLGNVFRDGVMSITSRKRLLEISNSLSFSRLAISLGILCNLLPLRERLSRFSNLERIGTSNSRLLICLNNYLLT